MYVADENTSSWFSFDMPEQGQADHSITILPEDDTVEFSLILYDQNQQLVATSTGTGEQVVDLNGSNTGSYFVEITANATDGTEPYDLTFNTPDVAVANDWTGRNDKSSKPLFLGVLGGLQVYSGIHLLSNSEDWFEIQEPILVNTTEHSLRVDIVRGGTAVIKIYDDTGTELATGTGSGLIDLSFPILGNGRKLLMSVSSANGPVSYTLTLAPKPLAAADQFVATEDNSLTVPVDQGSLSNDIDVNSSVSTASVIDQPDHGSLTFSPDGSFIYSPDENYSGIDQFTYYFDDGLSVSNSASVTIDVTAVNDIPVSIGDQYTTNEDARLTIATNTGVLANDIDVDIDDTLTSGLVTNVSHGVLALATDGAFVYTPDATFQGKDHFIYIANDGTANGSDTSVSITVTDYPWHNLDLAMDVNGDLRITATDALVIINAINSDGAHDLPSTRDGGAIAPFVDTTSDNYVAPIDVLRVINLLNTDLEVEGEGEAGDSLEFLYSVWADGNVSQSATRLPSVEVVQAGRTSLASSPDHVLPSLLPQQTSWRSRVGEALADLADDNEELFFGEEDWLGDSIDELLDGSSNARDLSRLR